MAGAGRCLPCSMAPGAGTPTAFLGCPPLTRGPSGFALSAHESREVLRMKPGPALSLIGLLAFAWAPVPVFAADPAYQCPTHCRPGYALRRATSSDRVCVPVAVRDQVTADNDAIAFRRQHDRPQPTPDPNRPVSFQIPCRSPFVWRYATANDYACVDYDQRTQAQQDNGFEVSTWRCADYPSKIACSAPLPSTFGFVIAPENVRPYLGCQVQDATVGTSCACGIEPFGTWNPPRRMSASGSVIYLKAGRPLGLPAAEP